MNEAKGTVGIKKTGSNGRVYKSEDLSGRVFGRLTVEGFARRNASGNSMWLCRCSCAGASTITSGSALKAGRVRSCGCLLVEHGRTLNRTHGMSESSEHKSWTAMIERCERPSNASYKRYGAVGITVCPRWRAYFENFYADMGPKPSPNHTIERRDGSLRYEPKNCKWATRVEQCNNRKSNHLITHLGRTQTLANWARELGLTYKAMQRRVYGGTWPPCSVD
jgi:hypothetical protein